MPDGLCVVDAAGRFIEVNGAYCRISGYAREEILGQSIGLVVPPEEMDGLIRLLQGEGQSQSLAQRRHQRKDGTTIWIEGRAALISGEDGQRLLLLTVSDLTECRRAEADTRARTALLAAVREVGAEITREPSLDRLLDLIVRRAAALVGVESGLLLLWEPARQQMVSRVHTGAFLPMPSTVIALGEGLVGEVAATRRGRIVNDYRTWSGARPVALAHTAVVAGMAEPLLYHDRLIGVINLARQSGEGAFTEEDAALLRLFADQAAIAIENARLYEGAQGEVAERREAEAALADRTRQLESVRAITAEITRELDLPTVLRLITRRACELTGAAAGDLDLWDDGQQLLQPTVSVGHAAERPSTPRRLGEGAMGTVAQRRRGLCLNDYRGSGLAHPATLATTRITASLVEPLLYGDRLLGVLGVDHETEGRVFTARDQALLRLLADQAAIAIENAQLFEAAQREIAARKEAEAALQRLNADLEARVQVRTAEVVDREAQLQRFLDTASDLILRLTPDGTIHYANRAAARLHGAGVGLVGRSLEAQVVPGHGAACAAALARVGATGEPAPVAWSFRTEGGEPLHVEGFFTPRKGGGQVVGVDAILHDVTARQEAETALRRTNIELQRTMQAKDGFLTAIYHELRTPMNAVLGFTEALQGEIFGDLTEKQRNALQRVQTSGQRLLSLLNDILDLSTLEAGKIELSLAPVDLATFCQACLDGVRGAAREKDQTVTSHLDPAVPVLLADGRRLLQLLGHLLGNAVKFTPDGGSLGLEVAGDRGRGTVRFTVWDSGIGIAEADLSRLFQPFVQLDNSLARKYEGTGLGLSLAARLAALHGGHVEVESTPGQGSRFTVWLPWRPPEKDT